MYFKLTLLYIFINLKMIAPQYYNNPQQYYENIPMQYYQLDGEDQYPPEYDNMETIYGPIGVRSANVNYQYDDQDCECSCDRCKQPKPCCYYTCYSCPPSTAAPVNGNQNNLVFVPYPYPLTVPFPFQNNSSPAPVADVKTPQQVSTTTSTTTTTTTRTTPANALRNYQHLKQERSLEESFGHRNSKLLNPIPKRRTRPAWVPKYGIVPIPDQLAVKLMSQLRDVRTLQAKRL